MTGGRALCWNEFEGYRPLMWLYGLEDLPADQYNPVRTRFYGDQLIFPMANHTATDWVVYMRQFLNLSIPYSQAYAYPNFTPEMLFPNYGVLPFIPVQSGNFTLLDCSFGKDGYEAIFAGTLPFFRQDQWYVDGNNQTTTLY